MQRDQWPAQRVGAAVGIGSGNDFPCEAYATFCGCTGDRLILELLAIDRMRPRPSVGVDDAQTDQRRFQRIIGMVRRTSAAIEMVATRTAYRIEQRSESITSHHAGSCDDPGIVEEAVADRASRSPDFRTIEQSINR